MIKIFKDLPAPRHVFSVYVIVCNNQSFYIGQTDNLIRRWEEHKQGKASWTKKYKPVEIIHYEHFHTRDEAVKREKALKTGFGRKWLKREFKKNNLNKWDENVARQAGKQTDIIEKEILTKKWTDWIDYWSVDFDFESKKEIIRVPKEKSVQFKIDGSSDAVQMQIDNYEEKWTGSYIFENKWQSFRTKKDRSLELTSAFKEAQKGKMKIAVKVIDIFGNDTTKVIEINI